jgi:hypothetical protein
VERVTQEKLYDQFLGSDLGGEVAQSDLSWFVGMPMASCSRNSSASFF